MNSVSNKLQSGIIVLLIGCNLVRQLNLPAVGRLVNPLN